MLYRTLGKTGWQISAIGFGAWGIGGQWGPVDDSSALQTVRAAHEAGVTFFDTADIYGEPQGRSEELLGRALHPVRDQVHIATKVGNWASRFGHIIPFTHPSHIELCCDASLGRLKTDHIDLYQCHVRFPPDPDIYLDAFEALRRKGKIRAGGISTDSLRVVREFNRRNSCFTVQLDYNILDRTAENGLLPYCRENGIGVIARRPLATGVATGKFSRETQFSDAMRRGWNTGSEREEFLRRAEIVEQLRFLERPGRTMAQAALQFALAHPAVSVAIPGARTPEQARANAAAADSTLDPAELERVRALSPIPAEKKSENLRRRLTSLPRRVLRKLLRRA
jgi:myo-inositol catabolism protein IolS